MFQYAKQINAGMDVLTSRVWCMAVGFSNPGGKRGGHDTVPSTRVGTRMPMLQM